MGDLNIRLYLSRRLNLVISNPTPETSTEVIRSFIRAKNVDNKKSESDLCNKFGTEPFD